MTNGCFNNFITLDNLLGTNKHKTKSNLAFRPR